MALSRSAVDKAGENIRAAARRGDGPAPIDVAVIEEFRTPFGDVVAAVHARLKTVEEFCRADPGIRELVDRMMAGSGHTESTFLSVSSRPKTVAAIVAKLARSPTRLSQMQDIAGGRIVLPAPALQDEIVEGLRQTADAFPLLRLTDTRETGDIHGYRAVHAVIEVEGRPAEVQIRTPLQQLWAQLVESLDQELGLDMKHGSGPAPLRTWLKQLSHALREAELGRDIELPSPPRWDDLA